MRVLKATLAVGLLLALAGMWLQRSLVLDAYAAAGRSSADLHLDGVDLDVALTPLEASPYQVALAPDTRSASIDAVFRRQQEAITAAPGGAGDDPTQPASPPTTLPPPPLHGGTARLTGVVSGPDGPVPFATVRVERHTTDGVVVKDLTADAEGAWTAPRLLGGRYRVRAWAQELLTMPESVVFFLAEAETRPVELTLVAIDEEPAIDLFDGGDIFVGLTGEIAVSVTVRSVDENGLVVVSGLPGAIVLLSPSPQVTATPTVAVADHDGVARFTLRCNQLGEVSGFVQHQTDIRSFALPSCVPIPPPPPPPVPADGEGAASDVAETVGAVDG